MNSVTLCNNWYSVSFYFIIYFCNPVQQEAAASQCSDREFETSRGLNPGSDSSPGAVPEPCVTSIFSFINVENMDVVMIM